MKPSFILYIFNFILFILLLFPWYPVYVGKKTNIGKESGERSRIFYGTILLLLSIFAFSDFDFWGCWFAYNDSQSGYSSGIIEPIYDWLATVCPNYFYWRLVVWGVALYLMLKTLLKLHVNYNSTFLFITLLYVLSFYKLRNVLGFSVLFWGLTLIVTSKNSNLKNKIIGLSLIILSFWCHRSMILSIAMLGSCFITLSKKKVSLLIMLWPFLITVVTIILNSFLNFGIDSDADSMNFMSKATGYITKENEKSTLFGSIRTVLTVCAYLLPLLYMTKKIIFERISIPKSISYFFNYWFFVSYIAYLFAFQDSSNWIYVRINTMGFFPMCIVLGWYWATHKRTTTQKAILLLDLFIYLFSTTYMLYKSELISRFSGNQF